MSVGTDWVSLEAVADVCRRKGISALTFDELGHIVRLEMGPAPADTPAIAATAEETDPAKVALEAKRKRYGKMFPGKPLSDEQLARLP